MKNLPGFSGRFDFAVPGVQWSDYPERTRAQDIETQGVKGWIKGFGKTRGSQLPRVILEPLYRHYANQIHVAAADLSRLSASELLLQQKQVMRRLRGQTRASDNRYAALCAALALVGLAIKNSVGLTPFVSQYCCALALLDQRFAEMATGEGKTVAAAMAAAVSALAGSPVHMLTANDYLAARDAEKLAAFFQSLGLTVAAALGGHSPDERLVAYKSNVVYATAKTIAFDYLRDRLIRSKYSSELERRMCSEPSQSTGLMLSGLCVAIVDEADSILIDEAKIPLIISDERKDAAERARLWQSLDLARQLHIDVHFVCHRAGRFVKLTQGGKDELTRISQQYGRAWLNRRHREELVVQALVALHIMACDIDYLVRDDEIHIIDPITGRIAEGRVWSRGLHGLIALKENVKMPPNTETLASITFPRFFARYHHLCGLSGTIEESARELKANYSAAIVRVNLRLSSRRTVRQPRLFANQAVQLHALVEHVKALSLKRAPMLIATQSVEHSQYVQEALRKSGIEAELLNARHDAQEAAIVSKAGRLGAITVATQMAGRGTDISLERGAAELGGLHVINLQLNPSPRQDRQVRGRCARQGDPGCYEHWICADYSVIQQNSVLSLMARLATYCPAMARVLLYFYQTMSESNDLKQREQVKRRDQQWAKQLSFAKIVE